VQIPRRPRPGGDVVPALHDNPGNVAQAMCVVDHLALAEEPFVREVMVLDTRERQREVVIAVLRDDLGIRLAE